MSKNARILSPRCWTPVSYRGRDFLLEQYTNISLHPNVHSQPILNSLPKINKQVGYFSSMKSFSEVKTKPKPEIILPAIHKRQNLTSELNYNKKQPVKNPIKVNLITINPFVSGGICVRKSNCRTRILLTHKLAKLKENLAL